MEHKIAVKVVIIISCGNIIVAGWPVCDYNLCEVDKILKCENGVPLLLSDFFALRDYFLGIKINVRVFDKIVFFASGKRENKTNYEYCTKEFFHKEAPPENVLFG
jgi:hypothetical protein